MPSRPDQGSYWRKRIRWVLRTGDVGERVERSPLRANAVLDRPHDRLGRDRFAEDTGEVAFVEIADVRAGDDDDRDAGCWWIRGQLTAYIAAIDSRQLQIEQHRIGRTCPLDIAQRVESIRDGDNRIPRHTQSRSVQATQFLVIFNNQDRCGGGSGQHGGSVKEVIPPIQLNGKAARLIRVSISSCILPKSVATGVSISRAAVRLTCGGNNMQTLVNDTTFERTLGSVHAGSRRALWAGRIMSGLIASLLAFDAVAKLLQLQAVIDGTLQLGYPRDSVIPIGLMLLACVVLYAIPRTSILGAILLTGYLGGAIATHVRVGNPLFTHILFPTYIGALCWGGLVLRDARLRVLLSWVRRGQP
jgi:hypothetical protein